MKVLFPENPLNKSEADDIYHEEFLAMQVAGYECSLFDFDALAFGDFAPHPKIQTGDRLLYRGWMLNGKGYETLTKKIAQKGGISLTSSTDYLRCHHLPAWYDKCSEFTAESHFFEVDEDLEKNVAALGWDAYFVKDFVKSNNADKGSMAKSPAQVREIVEQLELYRGEVEGGVSIRRVEEYLQNSECRYFVVNGQAYAPDGKIPDLVTEISHLIDTPFYSIDIIENTKGELRLVELGDGQVSSRKNWPLKNFIEMLTAIAKI